MLNLACDGKFFFVFFQMLTEIVVCSKLKKLKLKNFAFSLETRHSLGDKRGDKWEKQQASNESIKLLLEALSIGLLNLYQSTLGSCFSQVLELESSACWLQIQ